ncbi:hypothetical protein D3C81_1351030 [compost metagenome]
MPGIGQQALAIIQTTRAGLHHQHVIGTGFQQVIDPTEQLPVLVDDPQAFQLIPIDLVILQRRQLAAWHKDEESHMVQGLFAIVESLDPDSQHLAMQAATDQFDLADLAIALERPMTVVQQVLQRVGVGIHLHFTADAEHRNDFAENDQILSGCRRMLHHQGLRLSPLP